MMMVIKKNLHVLSLPHSYTTIKYANDNLTKNYFN